MAWNVHILWSSDPVAEEVRVVHTLDELEALYHELGGTDLVIFRDKDGAMTASVEILDL